MSDLVDVKKALTATGDGRSSLAWVGVFMWLLLRSTDGNAPHLRQLKYLFFAAMVLLIFIQFRLTASGAAKTSVWGLVNVNAFGFAMLLVDDRP